MMKTQSSWRRSQLLIIAASATIAQSAHAQEGDPPKRTGEPGAASGDIVVTARRRAEQAADVPASLNVFSGAELSARGVNSLADLQSNTPGLKVAIAGESARISLRGVGTNIGSGAPSVAVHLDGVYIPDTQFALTELFDLDRVEVLKGPQGTLYGRNATGGVVNIVSRAPGPDMTVDGWVGYGSYDLLTLQAGATLPLGDRGGIRLSGAYSDDDGYTRNVNPAGGEINSRGYRGGRLRGRYSLTETLTADVTVQYSDDDGTLGYGGTNNPSSPVFASVPPAQRISPLRINVDTPPRSRRKGLLTAGTLSLELGNVTLKSITGYVDYRFRKREDLDGSGGFIAFSTTDYRSRTFSQELQILGETSGGLKWNGGLYYASQRSRGRGIETDADYPDPSPYLYTDVSQRLTDRNLAAFGEITAPLGSRFSATLGARYTSARQRGAGVAAAPLFLPAPVLTNASIEDDGFAPKAMIEYSSYEGGRIYASATRGFKSGGVNIGFDSQTYRPEKIWAYEIGSKNRFANGRGELSIAGFYYDYTDLQLRTALFTDTGIDIRVTNAARATIKGLELATRYEVGPVVSVDLNGAYIHSDLKRFISPVTETEISGLPLPLSPEWSFTAGIEGNVPLTGDDRLTGRLEVNYQSSVNFPQFTDLSRERQDGYVLLNANLRYDLPGDRIYVALIGRNMTDKRYLTQRFYFSGFADNQFYAPPRTIEARVGFRL